MVFWFEIVEGYDHPKIKDPTRRDDGTYSQMAVILILIYLIFGSDYPYNIANFFKKLSNDRIKSLPRFSTLRHESRLSSLLKTMNKDGLVILNKVKGSGRYKSCYKINSKILESPGKDRDYFRSNGSVFKIPIELVEEDLAILEKCNKEHKLREKLFSLLDPNEGKFDYIRFLTFLRLFTADMLQYDAEQYHKIGIKVLPLIATYTKEVRNCVKNLQIKR